VFDSYGYARVQNADANGGASATGIRASTCEIYNCHGYAKSSTYSLSTGLVCNFVTAKNCTGQAYANTSYLANYEYVYGISSNGLNSLYNCVGVAYDYGASASLIAVGILCGNDTLIGCTAKAVSDNGTANDIQIFNPCYMSDTNFDTVVWDDPNNPADIYALNGIRNYEKFLTVTADTDLTGIHSIIYIDATSNDVTITLPKADLYKRRKYIIKRLDGSAYTATVDGYSSETIDDNLSITLSQYEEIQVHCDGTEWWKIGSTTTDGSTLSSIVVNEDDVVTFEGEVVWLT
jgi:hypothetical protein